MADTIRAVAIDHFFEKGYFAASISEIAAGCGIRKASIYYHFQSKEELLFNIMRSTMDDLLTHLNGFLDGATGFEARMRAAVRSHVIFHLTRQKETFIASSELRGLSPEHYEAIVGLRDAYEHIFQQLISAGIAQGVFQPGDVKILSYAILTLCTAGASWFRPQGRLSAEAVAGIYEHFILNGLQADSLPAVASRRDSGTRRAQGLSPVKNKTG